ncbi:TPA: PAS domain-containing hybrid sensor histidine kinase/response regulator [Candidatus Poribacteria bacterium]|nr:PAS domain-containing hybrid sensor histidine kinase/response regulator [Candidatus Poribacteria bacterium]
MLSYKDLLISGPEAFCLANKELIIIKHNQLLCSMLGKEDRDLNGENLLNIFYDDSVIQRFMKQDDHNHIYQGECLLKTEIGTPLLVKFRMGQIADDISNQILYFIAFKEIDELQRFAYSRRINALKSILNSVMAMSIKPEEILNDFIRAYDQHAIAFIFDPNSNEKDFSKNENHALLSRKSFITAQIALHNKMAIFYHDEYLWGFFPIYSEKEDYGVACVRFSIPRWYDDEDKKIFLLCGKIIGSYIERDISPDQSLNFDSLLRLSFDNVQQPIIAVNRKGLITKVNDAVKAVYGYNDIDMLGKSFGEFVFLADTSMKYDDLLNSVLKGNIIIDKEMTHIRSDLSIVDVSLSAYPHRLDDGTIIGAIFIIQDIGQQKRLMDRMKKMEKLSVLGELLYSAANELNNSLTSVIGHSEILSFMSGSSEISEITSKIYNGSLRCGSIVSGLLDLAREAQKGYASTEEALRLALDLKNYQLRSNNIHINIHVDKYIPKVLANLYDLEKIFLHIINDAEQRMLEYDNGGMLNIEISTNEKNVVVCFTDTGTCLLKQNMNEILTSINNSSIYNDYINIGLITACQILEKIGGTMRIESQIGKDNKIIMEFPSAPPIPYEICDTEDEFLNKDTVTVKKVLLVDDENDIAELLQNFLQKQGYTVDIANDGNEAINKVYKSDYDVIISDLKMPNGFTGDKLHGFVKRKNPVLADRMIFMTGDIINPKTQKFLQQIKNHYLEKPFSLEALMEMIKQIIG